MNEIENILKMSPPFLLALVLTGFGKVLKATPRIPDWSIPYILPIIGAVIYPWVADAAMLTAKVSHPTVLNALYGVGIGGWAVGLNQAFRQWPGRKATNEQESSATRDGAGPA